MLVESLRGRPQQSFRRLRRGAVPAQIGGRRFTIRYHRGRALVRIMQPWFRFIRARGIGVFVPPSSAEPWVSRHPRFLALLEAADRIVSAPLSVFGDHVLYHFERTAAKAP
jgi:hypothetical protein